jgi:beta-lactamase regulating signal transducer with metallopeptidase domain
MAAELLALLLEATLLTTAAVVAVLLLRGAWSNLFGVRAAILLWSVVPVAALVALAPDRIVEDAETPAITMPLDGWLQAQEPVTVAGPNRSGVLPLGAELVLIGWGVGAMGMLGLQAIRQRRFLTGLGRLSAGGGRLWVSERRDIGPLVLGAFSPKVIVPPDFADRFSTRQRRLMLAHEYAHLRRGDPAWNLVSAVLRCLFWFNPLIHLAANRFRCDQELACDARVLEPRRRSHRSYAAALLALDQDDQSYPALTFGSHPLKERIMQISTMKHVTRYRRRIGAIAALVVGTGLAAAAWAATPSTDGTIAKASGDESSGFFAFDVEITVAGQKAEGRLSLTGDQAQVIHDGSDEPMLMARDTLTINYDEGEPGWRAEMTISRHSEDQFFLQAEVWQDGLLRRTPSILFGGEGSALVTIGSESGGEDFRLKVTPVSQDRISALTTPLPVEKWPDEILERAAAMPTSYSGDLSISELLQQVIADQEATGGGTTSVTFTLPAGQEDDVPDGASVNGKGEEVSVAIPFSREQYYENNPGTDIPFAVYVEREMQRFIEAEDARPASNGDTISTSNPGWQMSGSPPGRDGVMHCGRNRCTVRMCNDQECNIVGFEDGMAFDIARYPSTQSAPDALVSEFMENGSDGFPTHAGALR